MDNVKEQLDGLFIARLHGALPGVQVCREFKFCPTRKWRADWMVAYGESIILIEVEGGAFAGGRHTRGVGYIKDIEKYNMTQKMGYRLLRYTPQQFKSFDMVLNDIKTITGHIKLVLCNAPDAIELP